MSSSRFGKKTRYNWDEVRASFVTGAQSLTATAVTWGIPIKTVRARAAKHQWTKKRAEHRLKIYSEHLARSSEETQGHLTAIRVQVQDIVGSTLNQLHSLADQLKGAQTADELESILKAADKALELGSKALGLEDAGQAVKVIVGWMPKRARGPESDDE